MKKSVFYSYVKQWIHLALKFPVSSLFSWTSKCLKMFLDAIFFGKLDRLRGNFKCVIQLRN